MECEGGALVYCSDTVAFCTYTNRSTPVSNDVLNYSSTLQDMTSNVRYGEEKNAHSRRTFVEASEGLQSLIVLCIQCSVLFSLFNKI